MLEHLIENHQGLPAVTVVASIRDEVLADRAELEAIMAALGISQSVTRTATAWHMATP